MRIATAISGNLLFKNLESDQKREVVKFHSGNEGRGRVRGRRGEERRGEERRGEERRGGDSSERKLESAKMRSVTAISRNLLFKTLESDQKREVVKFHFGNEGRGRVRGRRGEERR